MTLVKKGAKKPPAIEPDQVQVDLSKIVWPAHFYRLTDQQRNFVKAAVTTGSFSQAAALAGYNRARAAYRALSDNPSIYSCVRAGREQIAEQYVYFAKRVIAEYQSIAFFNLKDLVENVRSYSGGWFEVDSIDDIPDQVWPVISEVEQRETAGIRVTRFKFYDKMQALDALSKIIGLQKSPLDLYVQGASDRAPDPAEKQYMLVAGKKIEF